eukprot:Phypoly_transcript_13384.p1 GENE.Phypoly_transcript_13384~~Phypoly_transcript_13384.p1  ORF type:complete len:318 (+),score=67.96 Phypoly_transcript_13384:106-1059(+)
MAQVNNAPTKRMFNMNDFKQGVIFVLENAYLETAKIGTEYKLLNCDDHVGFLTKKQRDPSHARPDIAHQCMMTLMDSPLNKAGLMKVYVHTQKNMLIDVNPKVRLPRTFKRFSGLMVQLLHKLSIKAEGEREPVLRLVKGPVTKYFPPNATVIGTSFSSDKLVDIFDFVPSLYESTSTKKEDEDAKEPSLKKIKVEQIDSDDEEVKQEEKEEEDEEEDKSEESNSGSEEDDEEDENEKEEEEVDEPPQNFDVKESFTFNDKVKKEDKVIVFVVGAMSHGKVSVDYVGREISISQYPLSGSVACGKICAAFEKYFGII